MTGPLDGRFGWGQVVSFLETNLKQCYGGTGGLLRQNAMYIRQDMTRRRLSEEIIQQVRDLSCLCTSYPESAQQNRNI